MVHGGAEAPLVSVPDLLSRIGMLLREPLLPFVDPSERIYWPFLLSSALMAAVVFWIRRGRRGGARSLAAYLFPKRIFFHRSSLLDARLFLVNGFLRLGLPSAALTQAAVAALVSTSLTVALGGDAGGHAPPAWVPVAYTVSLFVADDLTRFLVHRLMHRVPALWELHKVHHSAEVLTPLTLYRIHPLESVLMTIRSALTAGAVTGVFFFFFRNALTGWAVFGLNALGLFFTTVGSNLRHSHVWISFGPIERLFMSPAQHQIHHSRDPRHHDKNFGAFLSFWDALGGSLYCTREDERLVFGLDPEDENHGPTLASTYVGPVRAIFARRGRARADQTLRPSNFMTPNDEGSTPSR
jgi:sterol desaturase/sphingolipid hydroxylase (fatty acid hydroxylase superfamily)